MTKYSDIEIKTAENLLEQGYKWLMRNSFGTLFTYGVKQVNDPEKYMPGTGIYVCSCFVPIFESVKRDDKEPVSLEDIVHPQILDDAERRYLKGVIRPFRNQIISIYKEQFGFNHESIIIEYYDVDRSHSTLCLPQFEKGSMYAWMKQGKHYTLEELGL